MTVEVVEEDEDAVQRPDVQALPWFGSSDPGELSVCPLRHTLPDWLPGGWTGVLVPLRANRSVFLPLWNNVDFSGEQWQERAPAEDEDEGRRPSARVSLPVSL